MRMSSSPVGHAPTLTLVWCPGSFIRPCIALGQAFPAEALACKPPCTVMRSDEWQNTSHENCFVLFACVESPGIRVPVVLSRFPRSHVAQVCPQRSSVRRYKTHLRWDKHYAYGVSPSLNLPSETPGFPSVTSAFLRVLSALQKAEEHRTGRSILQVYAQYLISLPFHHA